MRLHPDTWDLPTSTRLAPYLNWGQVLADLGRDHPEIVVLTADLKHSNRLTDFAQVHPERFFDFGIAEKNMVSAAAGMAAAGLLPYVATYASFIGLLCAEQIRTDVCYPRLPVRILAHHAGIAMGFYGSSHHATEDLAIMRSFAELTVFCTSDFLATCWDLVANEIAKMRYMTGGQVCLPLVIRTANGGGLRFGAQHSQSVENWAMAVPGLKVVAPATPADVKGLLKAAIRDDDPVILNSLGQIPGLREWILRRLPCPLLD